MFRDEPDLSKRGIPLVSYEEATPAEYYRVESIARDFGIKDKILSFKRQNDF